MAEHAHAAGSHGDHNHEIEHIRGHIKVYVLIFAMLILGTIVTVAISYKDFGAPWINITIGLIIATIKASLVAGWFMHLVSERRMVHSILVVCGFMFAVLVFLFVWTMSSDSLIGGGKHQHLRDSEGAAAAAPAHAPAH
jgi:cytochrome c oxidase subunit 4